MEKITFYFKGWLKSQNFENNSFFTEWKKKAIQSENENFELVVFKIPKEKNNEIITEIAELIKRKYIIENSVDLLKKSIDNK